MKIKKSLFIFVAAIVISFLAFDYTVVANADIRVENVGVTGEKMSVDDYKMSYSGPMDERKDKSKLLTYQNVALQINSISIVNDEILLDYELEGFHTSLKGLLYNSSRNLDNIVAVFEDGASDYKVLFFEITKGTQELNLLYNTALNSKPHIKFYFLDSQNNIYLFETALPPQLLNLTISNTESCDVYNDYLWYVNIVDCYITQTGGDMLYSACDDDNLDSEAIIKRNIAIAANKDFEDDISVATTTPMGPMVWGSERIYETTATNGVDETTYKFYPYGHIRGCNVAAGSNSTWWGTLEISEHTSTRMINSTGQPVTTYGVNRFSVRNLKISIVSGNDTMMVRTMIDGKTKESGGKLAETGAKIAARLYKKIMSVVPHGKTATEILDWLSVIPTSVANEVTLGSTGIMLNSSFTSASKLDVDSKYVFNKYTEASGGGHILTMQVDLTRTTDSSEMTTGAVRINFDVYENLLTRRDSQQIQKSFLYSDTDFDNGSRYPYN